MDQDDLMRRFQEQLQMTDFSQMQVDSSAGGGEPLVDQVDSDLDHHHHQNEEEVRLKFKSATILYPAYFDARKSYSQGRRIPVSLAINTDPTQNGIPLTTWNLAAACNELQLEVLVEDGKRYSRDYWAYGRVRVRNNKFKNKRQLMISIAKLLPSIQRKQLQSIQQQQQSDQSQSTTSLIDPETFPFSSNSKSQAAIKYAYGAIPLASMRPKVNNPSSSSTAAPPPQQQQPRNNKNRKKL